MTDKRKIDECSVLIDSEDEWKPPAKKSNLLKDGLASFVRDLEWKKILELEFSKTYFTDLEENLEHKYRTEIVYPSPEKLFEALNLCPFSKVKVVILGQDPYHDGNAMGIAFSVPEGHKLNPSLRNIFKEIANDVGQCKDRKNGDLTGWCKQGVLLLNTILSVRQSLPKSHQGIGWETLTNKIIQLINSSKENVVFMLWGKQAKEKQIFINNKKHLILTSAHPSPFSESEFFGHHHFSKCNEFLSSHKLKPIDWDA